MVELGRGGALLVQQCDAPGKIVINSAGGNDEANQLGRVFLLSDNARQKAVRASANRSKARPILLQGVAPPEFAENAHLTTLARARNDNREKMRLLPELARRPIADGGLGVVDWNDADRPTVLWLGQELELRRYCTPILRRSNDNNLLIIVPDHGARFGILAAAIQSLCVNASENPLDIIVGNFGHPDATWTDAVSAACKASIAAGVGCTETTDSAKLSGLLEQLEAELRRRQDLPDAELSVVPGKWLVLCDAHRARCLQSRGDEYEGSDATQRLRRLIDAGPQNGIHVVLSFDTLHGLRRTLNDQDLRYFLHRVATRIPDQESFALVEDRIAAQLPVGPDEPLLAVYRAQDVGTNRVFKPYIYRSVVATELICSFGTGRTAK
jgi:S-DNA-T family DNA segregation ATPase FtsK/SpoIIIE